MVLAQPFAADDARAAAAPRGDVQLVHQPVDRSQARAAGAGGGETVAQGLLDIGDAGAAVARFNLQADPPAVGQRRQGQRSAPCVLDQVGGQFGHGQGDFLAGRRREAQGVRPAPWPRAAPRPRCSGWRTSMVCGGGSIAISSAICGPPRSCPCRPADRMVISSISRLAPGKPMPSPLPVLKPASIALATSGIPGPLVLEGQFQTHAAVPVQSAASA